MIEDSKEVAAEKNFTSRGGSRKSEGKETLEGKSDFQFIIGGGKRGRGKIVRKGTITVDRGNLIKKGGKGMAEQSNPRGRFLLLPEEGGPVNLGQKGTNSTTSETGQCHSTGRGG